MIELVGKDIKIIIMIVFHMVMKLSERLHILSGDMEGMFKKKKKTQIKLLEMNITMYKMKNTL